MTQAKEVYLAKVRALSDRIVTAQRPIRVLDAIKWTQDIQDKFLAKGGKELPQINAEYYLNNPIRFDGDKKREEFGQILDDIKKQLGPHDKIGGIMSAMCEEYSDVVAMLQARGTPAFSQYAQKLYGSAKDTFYAGAPSLQDLASIVSKTLEFASTHTANEMDEKKYSDQEAVDTLNTRLNQYFQGHDKKIEVLLSDSIVADAAAGSEYIKIREGARFSERAIRVLEVHEGWVHLGTTMNGMQQPYCTFLSKGAPSATVTQEGLAVIMEIFTFSSHPDRMLGLSDRVHAIHIAEEGADFLEVFKYFRGEGSTDEEAYLKTMRVFRGSLPNLGPFTKDLVYNKGFILIYNFIRLAIRRGMIHKVPLLFVGKIALEDISVYSELVDEKIILPPKFLPPQFKDLAALSSWMCYSLFLNQLDLTKLSKEYDKILAV